MSMLPNKITAVGRSDDSSHWCVLIEGDFPGRDGLVDDHPDFRGPDPDHRYGPR